MLLQYKPVMTISRRQLDSLLKRGWFRFADIIAKIELVAFAGTVHAVQDIRYSLNSFAFKKSQRRILKVADSTFHIYFRKAQITPQKEKLYQDFKDKFHGFICINLEDYLHGDYGFSPLDTMELEVYDNNKLIAFSFFDIGIHSIAGLLCIYDRSYNKFSLGTYTMLKEIEYAVQADLRYYYPGYILNDSPLFDYKLNPGNVEYRDGSRWIKNRERIRRNKNLSLLNEKTAEIERELNRYNIPYVKKINPYYSYGFIREMPYPMIKSIIPFFIYPEGSPRILLLEFCLEEKAFILSEISRCSFYDFLKTEQDATYYEHDEIYNNELFIYESRLDVSVSAPVIINNTLMSIFSAEDISRS